MSNISVCGGPPAIQTQIICLGWRALAEVGRACAARMSSMLTPQSDAPPMRRNDRRSMERNDSQPVFIGLPPFGDTLRYHRAILPGSVKDAREIQRNYGF